jgi:hypothetical protein
MSKIEFNTTVRGRVSGGNQREITKTLRDSYQHFGNKVPYRVEIFVAETEPIMADFVKQEKFRLNINMNSNDDEEPISFHDSWYGYPRLTVCQERLFELSKTARAGALRHEAAHSVLHGSLEFHIFRISDECHQIALIKGIDKNVLELAMHYLSSAIKDCEATKFLIEHGYTDCQAAFGLEWLKPPSIEKIFALPHLTERQARYIYTIAMLKPVLFSHPLLALPKKKKISLELQVMLGRRIEEFAESLKGPGQNKFLQVAALIADNITEDTHKNVDSALHQAMSLA